MEDYNPGTSRPPNDIEVYNALRRVLREQNLDIGAGTLDALNSAILSLTSVTKGFLPPRMTTTQRDAITNPTAGLTIYNTTTATLNVYTTAWKAVTIT